MTGLHQEGEYELVLEVFEENDGFLLNLKYNPDLFDEATIERMTDHYVALAAAVVEKPAATLGEYSLLTAAEHDTIGADVECDAGGLSEGAVRS